MGKNLFVYLAIVLGALAISLDFASIDLALPALEGAFGLNFAGVQWVINGYVLAFAVLMVAGGRMADSYGRRRVFLMGMGVFAVASLGGGMAWSGGSVIAFRVLQGVGAAMLWPAMIGMACGAVGEKRTAFALGLIFATCSVGNAAGPVVGGALTEWFSWRWVLWVNVPMAVVAMAVTMASVANDRPEAQKARNDYLGTAVLVGGLVAVMAMVYQGPVWGWGSGATIWLGVLGLGLLVAFPIIEGRVVEPLVPLDLMRHREIQALCLCAVVISQMFFVVLLYFTQFGLKFLGDDPVTAGARVVPFMLSYGVVSFFGGRLIGWMGTRRLMLTGLASGVAAAVWLGLIGPGAEWINLNAALVLLGIGVGAVIPTVSSRAIDVAGTERASLVSGITFMAQLAGSAVMLAVNTAIFTMVSERVVAAAFARKAVTPTAVDRQAVESILAGSGSVNAVTEHTARVVPDFEQIVMDAYVAGLGAALYFSAALVAVVWVIAWRRVGAIQK